MRLSLSINGARHCVASLPQSGFLSAHVNLADRSKAVSGRVQVVGYDTSKSGETISLKWPTADISVGDSIEIKILDEGEGNPPENMRRSTEPELGLFVNVSTAKRLLDLVYEFENALMQVASEAKDLEPGEERKLGLAITGIVDELGNKLVYPIYRQHKDLIPEALQGDIL